MPEFCILFYAKYTILATQRGGHGPMAPPKHAPGRVAVTIGSGGFRWGDEGMHPPTSRNIACKQWWAVTNYCNELLF